MKGVVISIVLIFLGTVVYLNVITPEERTQYCLDEAFATMCKRIGGEVEGATCVSEKSFNTKEAGEYVKRLSQDC